MNDEQGTPEEVVEVSELAPVMWIMLPQATVGTPYSVALDQSLGSAPFSFTVTGDGLLPNGWSLDLSNGVLSGTPDQAGSYNFDVNVADASAETTDECRHYTITVAQ